MIDAINIGFGVLKRRMVMRHLLFMLLLASVAEVGCQTANPEFMDNDAGIIDMATFPRRDIAAAEGGAASDGAAGCVLDLSGVGTGDFTIRFKLATSANVASTVLYQRSTCDARHDLWDVQLAPAGGLRIAVIEFGGAYTDLTTTARVNDGLSHDIVIRRISQIMTTTTNGVFSGSASAPQKLTTLAPLGVASGNPCEVASVHPLVGTVSEVCLTLP